MSDVERVILYFCFGYVLLKLFFRLRWLWMNRKLHRVKRKVESLTTHFFSGVK